MSLLTVCQKLGENFAKKIGPEINLETSITLKDKNESVDISAKNKEVKILAKIDTEKDILFELTSETLDTILKGEIEAFTVAGKADIHDPAPLDWKAGPGFNYDRMDSIYAFMMFFFDGKEVKTVSLEPERSRLVHGANAIPLFYHTGFRSAW